MTPRVVIAVLTVVIVTLAIGSVRLDSATADEGAHIVSGLVKLKRGWIGFFPEQPPLANSISALPLVVAGYDVPKQWRTAENHWLAGYALLYSSGYDARRILQIARIPTVMLFLALAFFVYAFVARETGSRWWGAFAFALTGFCPNLIAHGRLATVDVAATCFMFAATVMFLRSLHQRQRPLPAGEGKREALAEGLPSSGPSGHLLPRGEGSAIAAGLFTACAVLSKTSALLLGPYFLILLIGYAIRRRMWRPFVRPVIISAIAALVVFEAVYLLETSKAYLDTVGEQRSLLMPFREYYRHIEAIRTWVVRGHERPQFLLGEFSYRGWPHYFPVALLLKVPIGAQLLVLGGAVLALRRRNPAVVACFLFVFLFLGVAMTSNINLGLRYVLPIFPFAFAGAAIGLASGWVEVRRKRAFSIATSVLLAWHVTSAVLAYPGYISYFNELVGSHRNADKFLIDSNLDWGQDLHRLKLWCDRNGVGSIRIDYFGAGDIRYEFGDRAEWWVAPRPEPLPKGWFAVSRHAYRSRTTETPVDYDTYLEASGAKYVDTVGGSIYVYRVE